MSSQPTAGNIYRIVSKHTPGRCWDVYQNKKTSGAWIINYKCHEYDNQKYLLMETKDGLQLLPQSTSLILGVEKNVAFANVEQLSSPKYCNWQLIPCLQKDGYFYIKLSTDDLYITLEGGCTEDWTKLVLNELTHGRHQQFKFE